MPNVNIRREKKRIHWLKIFGRLLFITNIKIDYSMMKAHSALALCSFSNNMTRCIWTSIPVTNFILFYVMFVFRLVFFLLFNLVACMNTPCGSAWWVCAFFFFFSIFVIIFGERGWYIAWELLSQRVACHRQFHWRCYKQYFMHECDPPPDLIENQHTHTQNLTT